jgi:hypothetical protein
MFVLLLSVKNNTKTIWLHIEKMLKTIPANTSVNQKPQKLISEKWYFYSSFGTGFTDNIIVLINCYTKRQLYYQNCSVYNMWGEGHAVNTTLSCFNYLCIKFKKKLSVSLFWAIIYHETFYMILHSCPVVKKTRMLPLFQI